MPLERHCRGLILEVGFICRVGSALHGVSRALPSAFQCFDWMHAGRHVYDTGPDWQAFP